MVVIVTTDKSWEPDPPCKNLAKKKAAKKLQSFARRRWQHQRQSPLVRSAVANPFWRPIEAREPRLDGEEVRPQVVGRQAFPSEIAHFLGSTFVCFLGVVISVFGGLYNSFRKYYLLVDLSGGFKDVWSFVQRK